MVLLHVFLRPTTVASKVPQKVFTKTAGPKSLPANNTSNATGSAQTHRSWWHIPTPYNDQIPHKRFGLTIRCSCQAA